MSTQVSQFVSSMRTLLDRASALIEPAENDIEALTALTTTIGDARDVISLHIDEIAFRLNSPLTPPDDSV